MQDGNSESSQQAMPGGQQEMTDNQPPLQFNQQYNQWEDINQQGQYQGQPPQYQWQQSPTVQKKTKPIIIGVGIGILLLVVTALLMQVRNKIDNSPEGVINKLIQSVKDKDFDMYIECFSEDTQNMLNAAKDKIGVSVIEKQMSIFDTADVKITKKEKISDEEYNMKVTTTINGATAAEEMTVKKEEGQWRIFNVKELGYE